MTATATSSHNTQTARTPWSSHSQSKSSTSTTPAAYPSRTPASVGQILPPTLSPHTHPTSTVGQQGASTSSPSYFGLLVQDDNDNPTNSDAGGYARKNWKTPSSSVRSRGGEFPPTIPHESNPSLAAFRKQSESKIFQLDTGKSIASASSPRQSISRTTSQLRGSLGGASPRQQTKDARDSSDESMTMDTDLKSPLKRPMNHDTPRNLPFEMPRYDSPANLPTLNSGAAQDLSPVETKHPRLSLPNDRIDSTSENEMSSPERANTLPLKLTDGQPALLSAQNFAQLMEHTSENLLLLDVRVSPQYAMSRIHGALNLCIPTTLLKRPSFNVLKLLETFTADAERQKFSQWKEMDYIVMYDANSVHLKDATSCVNTIKKFTNEGWKGAAYVVKGGFAEISKKFPDLIEKTGSVSPAQSGKQPLALNARSIGGAPVAGGLSMPAQQSAANPFFGNIRQNMDLIGGVGQMPIKQPDVLTHKGFKFLPTWLQRAAEEVDKGKVVSDDFLNLEKAEQERMRTALSTNVTYGTPGPASSGKFQMAGIEKGNKNRYKDILPFDHTRVKLQDVSPSACDYVNASFISTERSNRTYIATQAPIPATFDDFWRVIWEQDVRVIVMLSAETEGGQRKSHPYWLPDTYGSMKVKTISERKVALESGSSLNVATPSNFQSPLLTPQPERSTPRRRAVTHMNPFGMQDAAKETPDEAPHVVIRTMTLSHTSQPFQPMREVAQLHYSNWPDFGAPAHPADLLSLVELSNNLIRKYNGISNADAHLPAKPGERPIVVHCSAGCGRTGTFCTVDTVIDMLKHQRLAQKASQSIEEGNEMEVDGEAWLYDDEEDLIARTVNDFRHQRLSMVQTLRQYVLCYETILEWLVKEMPEKFRRDALRRSYGG